MSKDKSLAEFTPQFNTLHINIYKIREIVAADMQNTYTGGQDYSPRAQVY